MSDVITKENRNINIDIIKCLAIFFVISVHFFLNNNFYNTTINCPRMYVMVAMRTFFMMCVPLFILITGYLMNKKEFSAKYYIGLSKIIFPYIILTIITLIAKIFLCKYGIFPKGSFLYYLKDFCRFNLIEYAWYVEMYIGLYLLIPFVNKMFTDNKIQDTVLVLTMAFLTIAPVILTYWKFIWILAYYVIGAYIQRYKTKISQKYLIVMFISAFLFFSLLNILLSNGYNFNIQGLDSWYSIENATTSILFFLILLNVNFENLSLKIKNIISSVAKLSLGIYLSSYLFDNIIYHYFNLYITNTTAKLEWYLVIVPFVFICSLILAKFTDKITGYINKKITG